MKRLLAALTFCAFTTSALAETAIDPARCAEIEQTASNTMMIRQKQIRTLSEMIARAEGEEPALAIFYRSMVIDAYAEPLYVSEEMQQVVMAEFATEQALKCYKSAK